MSEPYLALGSDLERALDALVEMKSQRDALAEALREAEALYSSRGLLANSPDSGAWIGRARAALALLEQGK